MKGPDVVYMCISYKQKYRVHPNAVLLSISYAARTTNKSTSLMPLAKPSTYLAQSHPAFDFHELFA